MGAGRAGSTADPVHTDLVRSTRFAKRVMICKCAAAAGVTRIVDAGGNTGPKR